MRDGEESIITEQDISEYLCIEGALNDLKKVNEGVILEK